jgi:hypothetical protein
VKAKFELVRKAENFDQGNDSNVLATGAHAHAPHCAVCNGLHMGAVVSCDERNIWRAETSWFVCRRALVAGAESDVPKTKGGINTNRPCR